MNTWFTSDTHLGHARIIEYCHRPFKSLEEMDETIIRQWNERVKPNDIVYFLGDFCFKKSSEAPDGNVFDFYRDKLNGDIIFIRGNHDKNNKIKTILESAIIKISGQEILLVHNPHILLNRTANLVLCGHVHDKWKFFKSDNIVAVNCGVDVWGFKPVSINEIMAEKNRWCKNA